jgi:hypothetical protein
MRGRCFDDCDDERAMVFRKEQQKHYQHIEHVLSSNTISHHREEWLSF